MAKPIIIAVDDEPNVLNAVERDLRAHYRSEYQIIKANSAQEALETVHKLKQRNSQIALFLVDQRMPLMSGTEFLGEAIKVYPDARKVLLTAYADTQAAIASINQIGLDYYLMKPWDPPDLNLYPALDDLLSEWQVTAAPPYDGIRIAGTLWSAASHEIKDFLARNRIPYQWLDIEKDPVAKQMVAAVNPQDHRLPVVFFPDGSLLVQPDHRTLAEKVGLQTQASQPFYDLIIIGGGPAGLGAAVYGASEGLRTALIERAATGGQAGTSSRIENYLGFPKGLSGAALAHRATAQATRLGAEILTAQEVVQVSIDNLYRLATLADGSVLSCKAMIIATGVTVRKLDAPGADKYTGAGLYYGAALSEAAYYRGQPVLIVGGANSAGQAAMFLAQYASQVTMLVRATSLETGMSQYLVNQIMGTSNIQVLLNTNLVQVYGDERLTGVEILEKSTNSTRQLEAAALFSFIGAFPHSQPVVSLVECNQAGFILTGPDLIKDGKRPRNWTLPRDPYILETSVPGIFAAGDVRQGAMRRVASAVGEGATAVSLVHQYLKTV